MKEIINEIEALKFKLMIKLLDLGDYDLKFKLVLYFRVW